MILSVVLPTLLHSGLPDVSMRHADKGATGSWAWAAGKEQNQAYVQRNRPRFLLGVWQVRMK